MPACLSSIASLASGPPQEGLSDVAGSSVPPPPTTTTVWPTGVFTLARPRRSNIREQWPAACSAVAGRMPVGQAREVPRSAGRSQWTRRPSALHSPFRPILQHLHASPLPSHESAAHTHTHWLAVAHPPTLGQVLCTRLRRRRGALHVECAPRADDYRRCGLGSRKGRALAFHPQRLILQAC